MKRPSEYSKRTVGRRPKTGKPDGDTRAQILKAARCIFSRRGLDGASVREVAQAAKVNNAMIYYHFKDKVELYRAVLSDSFTAFDTIWDRDVFQARSTAREKLQQYIEELIRFQQKNEELRKIVSIEFASCGKNWKWLSDNFFSHTYDKLASILKEGMRNGELKKVDPSTAVAALVGMVIYSFIMRPMAEYVTGKKLRLTVRHFGAFVTGMFFDGLGHVLDGTGLRPGRRPAYSAKRRTIRP